MIWTCPQFNPVALQLGPLSIRWYGLAYVSGLLIIMAMARKRLTLSRFSSLRSANINIDDLIFYIAVSVIVGGRLGYMCFYGWQTWVNHPLSVFAIWQGGMSFHGACLGVLITCYIYAASKKICPYAMTCLFLPGVPIALGLGRLANFINGELWGRPTGHHWGMIYPWVDLRLRYPSQLIEFASEGLLLFFILWKIDTQDPEPRKQVGCFFLCYGCLRFGAEFMRNPDIQIGLIFHLSMGQWLCLPMLFLGICLWARPWFAKTLEPTN